MTFKDLEAAVLALAPDQRARLAERLLESLGTRTPGTPTGLSPRRSPADSVRDAQSGSDPAGQDRRTGDLRSR